MKIEVGSWEELAGALASYEKMDEWEEHKEVVAFRRDGRGAIKIKRVTDTAISLFPARKHEDGSVSNYDSNGHRRIALGGMVHSCSFMQKSIERNPAREVELKEALNRACRTIYNRASRYQKFCEERDLARAS